MMRLFLLLSITVTLTTAFQVQPPRVITIHHASKMALWQSECNNNEVSRREAILASTAAAAALAATPHPASAAVKIDINKAINDIELEYAGSVNTKGDPEKHLPALIFDRTPDIKSVEAGVPHVMDPEKPHYIEYMWIKDMKTGKIVASKQFKPTDPSPPSVTATNVKDGSTVKAFLFCNLHGLWQGEELTV